jgi:hypothetical protein
VAVALPPALALGLTEEAALMATAVAPAVADALVAEALAVADAPGEDVCATAAGATSITAISASTQASSIARAAIGTEVFLLNTTSFSPPYVRGRPPVASHSSRCGGVGAPSDGFFGLTNPPRRLYSPSCLEFLRQTQGYATSAATDRGPAEHKPVRWVIRHGRCPSRTDALIGFPHGASCHRL